MIDQQDFGPPVHAASPLEHGYHTLPAPGVIDLARWTLMSHIIYERSRAAVAFDRLDEALA